MDENVRGREVHPPVFQGGGGVGLSRKMMASRRALLAWLFLTHTLDLPMKSGPGYYL